MQRIEKMEQAVERAREAWLAAPAHYRMMGSKWVDPIVYALLEIKDCLKEMERKNGES